jgi:hypothetical protein
VTTTILPTTYRRALASAAGIDCKDGVLVSEPLVSVGSGRRGGIVAGLQQATAAQLGQNGIAPGLGVARLVGPEAGEP